MIQVSTGQREVRGRGEGLQAHQQRHRIGTAGDTDQDVVPGMNQPILTEGALEVAKEHQGVKTLIPPM